MRLYHHGDRGEPVRDIQDRLNALGFKTAADERGIFDLDTGSAVREFQASRGLAVDGIVGSDTWKALVDAGYRLGDRLLYHRIPMMRGDDVAGLQRALDALGFDAGKVDGIFGPETLAALLDFQRNRQMPEDGIAGREVAQQLSLLQRGTATPGRESVREREWLSGLPSSVAGQRIYVDAAARTPEVASATWSTALGFVEVVRERGAYPLLSRTVDTAPPESLRARRANRLGVHLVVSFVLPSDGQTGVFFFASEHSSSAAGRSIAEAIAPRLGVSVEGRATAMLKETRSPAVVVATQSPDEALGRTVGRAIVDLYSSGVADPHSNRSR